LAAGPGNEVILSTNALVVRLLLPVAKTPQVIEAGIAPIMR
jgi:hypothetical protein